MISRIREAINARMKLSQIKVFSDRWEYVCGTGAGRGTTDGEGNCKHTDEMPLDSVLIFILVIEWGRRSLPL